MSDDVGALVGLSLFSLVLGGMLGVAYERQQAWFRRKEGELEHVAKCRCGGEWKL